MTVLSWDKPARAMPVKEWQAISADSAPPGVYVSNMSEADRLKWKAKLIGGKDPRVEVRKSFGGVQALVVVRSGDRFGKYGAHVRMSMNGTAEMSGQEFADLHAAVTEAWVALNGHAERP